MERTAVGQCYVPGRTLPVVLLDVVQELLAEKIGCASERPEAEAERRLVDPRELAAARRLVHQHLREGVPAAAEGRPLRLLPNREALDEPGGLKRVREEQGRPSEDMAKEAVDAAGLLEVDDMGQLVSHHHPQPRFRGPGFRAIEGGGPDLHERVGKGRGEPVRGVVRIVHDHIEARNPDPVALLESGQDLEDQSHGPPGRGFNLGVEMDLDPAGLQGLEPITRRQGGRERRHGDEDGQGQRRDQPCSPGSCRSTHARFFHPPRIHSGVD